MTKSADFICRQNRLTKICNVMQKTLNFVSRQNRLSIFYLRRFCRPTFCISDNKFCLCCHGDCLQQKMNIYF